MYRIIVVAALWATVLDAASAREAAVLGFAVLPVPPEKAILSGEASAKPEQVLPTMRSFLAIVPRPLVPNVQSAPTGHICPYAQYRPAPWLSLAAEQRRLRHHAAIQQVACEVGLPANLLDALVGQESAYRHDAVSKAGAQGLTQLMPATARSLGIVRTFDPWLNLRGGARYFRQQIDRFKRVDLALAAYNAGPARKSLANGKIPRIVETRNYVRSVILRWKQLTSRASIDAVLNSESSGRRAHDPANQAGGVNLAVFNRE
ncbi:lytic transglycosylase domain-containing protein [Novosphingobium sp. SL115]|uniref:lytic transglycosylase domain-containing protein n=1 Tax=Novosphingobium sp. SL115 TaxID=2995150 RepID=UPI002276D1A9|nr:lytic transglycosylase domain-containing protein [Novosphingobium sp. SL115]MCY1669430.1 lytic transglycosylase domain-containing protein [Novosphingobium sp. SL115]